MLRIAPNADLVDVAKWSQWIVGGGVMGVTALVLGLRLRRVTPGQRAVLAPLFVCGILAVLFVPLSVHFIDDPVRWAEAQLIVLALIPVAFAAVLLRGLRPHR